MNGFGLIAALAAWASCLVAICGMLTVVRSGNDNGEKK